ncbi:MAG: hypothetical protein R6U21_00370 [Thermoplasmatota archaeon]
MSENKKNSHHGKWVLLDKKNKVIYSNKHLLKVVKKGKEYPKDEVVIEKNVPQRSCFF